MNMIPLGINLIKYAWVYRTHVPVYNISWKYENIFFIPLSVQIMINIFLRICYINKILQYKISKIYKTYQSIHYIKRINLYNE